ncbi:MAG TPA: hypothetical protein VHV51_05605, partial [Polyangiaceae bacterium]|nr:hypothetical protein [Polyangiaceae bacterium]
MRFPKLRTQARHLRTTGRTRVASRYALGAALSVAVVPACSNDSSSSSNPDSTAGTSQGGSAQAGANASGGSVNGGSNSVAGSAGNVANGGSSGSANGGTAGAGAGGANGGASGAAGASGASGSAGANGADCVTAGSELCEDFESGKIDPDKWKQNTSNMTSIAVETGHAHGGTYAVHLKFVAGMQNTVTIAEGVTFPATPNKFYSRMWAYFAPDIPKATNMDFHTGFMMGGGNNDKGTT